MPHGPVSRHEVQEQAGLRGQAERAYGPHAARTTLLRAHDPAGVHDLAGGAVAAIGIDDGHRLPMESRFIPPNPAFGPRAGRVLW